jgi:cytochrome c peroxidase
MDAASLITGQTLHVDGGLHDRPDVAPGHAAGLRGRRPVTWGVQAPLAVEVSNYETTSMHTRLFYTQFWWWVGGLGVVVSLVGLWASGWQGKWVVAPPAATAEEVLAESQEPLVPLPLHVSADPARVALGERLFHDVRLSGRNTIACATCHRLEQGGADGLPRPMTATGTLHARNTPTIFNVAFNAAYNWDGGVYTIEAHAERVLLSPALMHTTWPTLLAKLQAIPDYRAAFTALYPGRLTPAHVLDALATYERSLVTPNARFDRYLRNQPEALSPVERRGYAIFKAYGCVACHQGVNVGGSMFQKFGIFQEAPHDPTRPVDLGRFLLTQVPRDRAVFRVPSLRNVALTAPYFHDGRTATLEAAVSIMARVQLGRTLSPEDTQAIVQFLHTLTGEYQGRSLATLPAKD